MAETPTKIGGHVTITTTPGTKLTPEASKKLDELAAELQKTGASVNLAAGHCTNYVSCGSFDPE